MSKSNTFENDFLRLIFNAVAIANIADNATSAPLTNLYISLHTADPGETGDQTTSEATYGGYARVAVLRTAGGWVITNNVVNPAADIQFPEATSGSGIITHFGIGTAASGAGKLLFSGTMTPNVTIATGVRPIIRSTSNIVTED